jgi:uncharacterized protein
MRYSECAAPTPTRARVARRPGGLAYLDSSALVKLIVRERGTEQVAVLWAEADAHVSTSLLRVEARSAIARARLGGRLSKRQSAAASAALASVLDEIDYVEPRTEIVELAGKLAERHALRAYDAVHLASALALRDRLVAFATWDRGLADAAHASGLAVVRSDVERG